MTKFQPQVKLYYKFPLQFNDHTTVSDEKFIEAKNYFMKNYKGFTIAGTSVSYWTYSGMEYRDETVEYFVLVPKAKFLKKIKTQSNETYQQVQERF